MISVSKAAELVDHVGDAVKSSETVVIRDTMIDAFNTISEDRQWIHGAGAAPRIVPVSLRRGLGMLGLATLGLGTLGLGGRLAGRGTDGGGGA